MAVLLTHVLCPRKKHVSHLTSAARLACSSSSLRIRGRVVAVVRLSTLTVGSVIRCGVIKGEAAPCLARLDDTKLEVE